MAIDWDGLADRYVQLIETGPRSQPELSAIDDLLGKAASNFPKNRAPDLAWFVPARIRICCLQSPPMSRFKGYYDVIAYFLLGCLWGVILMVAYYSPHIARSSLATPVRVLGCVAWFALVLWIACRSREGGSLLGRIYRGENPAFPYSGAKGILFSIAVLMGFSALIGVCSLDVLVVSGNILTSSTVSQDFRVTGIVPFGKSTGNYYNINVEGVDYYGEFPWGRHDPALSGVEANYGPYRGPVTCLNITYTYWYLGGHIDSIARCQGK